MTPESDSLIEADGRQLTLLDLPEQYREALEGGKAGEFTGERLFEREPDKYRAIVAALAEGLGLRAIARAYKVSVNTVRGIMVRETGPIDTDKKGISLKLRQFARLAVDRMIEEVDSIPIDKLPIAAAIAVDKMQVLDGEATVITGSSADRIKVERFNDLIASLPQTGFRAGEMSTTREADAGPAALPAAGSGLVLDLGEATGTDGQSVVYAAESPN